MGIISDNLETLQESIAEACRRYGRSPSEVALMGVSKRQPWERIVEAYDAGLRLFGENRVQETLSKWISPPTGVELHLIGHLQRNKARDAAAAYSTVQSIDGIDTALALDKRRGDLPETIPQSILLEVNTSGEETKSGVASVEELLVLVEAILPLQHLKMEGLMTVGPLTTDSTLVRRAFSDLRKARDTIEARFPELRFPVLSMGMSGDYTEAIAEGSTMVRIGTALFGIREDR